MDGFHNRPTQCITAMKEVDTGIWGSPITKVTDCNLHLHMHQMEHD